MRLLRMVVLHYHPANLNRVVVVCAMVRVVGSIVVGLIHTTKAWWNL